MSFSARPYRHRRNRRNTPSSHCACSAELCTCRLLKLQRGTQQRARYRRSGGVLLDFFSSFSTAYCCGGRLAVFCGGAPTADSLHGGARRSDASAFKAASDAAVSPHREPDSSLTDVVSRYHASRRRLPCLKVRLICRVREISLLEGTLAASSVRHADSS